jgi:uncharacterized membrane protein YqaE (UPF0057 family)
MDVLSCGKVMGIMYTVFGFIAGICFALFASCAAALNPVADQPMAGMSGMAGMLFGVGAIVLMPILYGVLGFFGGMIMALLYNLTARLAGGIEFEVGE